MHIVIPMSGIGKRFIDGGYVVPKPLIKIDGKPIIQHVVELFPGENKFTFICNQMHLDTTNMRDVLTSIAPEGKIVSIEPHVLGPVYTVAQVFDCIDDDEEVIVNYCDFGTYWDYDNFLSHTRNRDADGVVVSYKGFHPHMLGKTKYATMREENQWMLEIIEKGSFTKNSNKEYVSNGSYYFKKGRYVKKYFKELMDKELSLNGEYYVSLIYNLMIDDGLKISIYDIEHMLQWGEPYDFASYRNFSNYFTQIVEKNTHQRLESKAVTLLSIGFDEDLYSGNDIPHGLLPVSGQPMITYAAKQLPLSHEIIMACVGEDKKLSSIKNSIENNLTNQNITFTPFQEKSTRMIDVYLECLKTVDSDSSVMVGAVDSYTLWNDERYDKLINDPDIDVIVWSVKDNPLTLHTPNKFHWLETNDNKIININLTNATSEGTHPEQHAVIGNYYFKSAFLFKETCKKLSSSKYDMDLISLCKMLADEGKNIVYFDVDTYISCKSMNEYKTFNYWQSYFYKSKSHVYDVINDPYIDSDIAEEVIKKFTAFKQDFE